MGIDEDTIATHTDVRPVLAQVNYRPSIGPVLEPMRWDITNWDESTWQAGD